MVSLFYRINTATIICLLLVGEAFSQPIFERNGLPDQLSFKTISSNNTLYVLLISKDDFWDTTFMTTTILKLNEQGQVLDSIRLNNAGDERFGAEEMKLINDSLYVLCSIPSGSVRKNNYLVRIDTALNSQKFTYLEKTSFIGFEEDVDALYFYGFHQFANGSSSGIISKYQKGSFLNNATIYPNITVSALLLKSNTVHSFHWHPSFYDILIYNKSNLAYINKDTTLRQFGLLTDGIVNTNNQSFLIGWSGGRTSLANLTTNGSVQDTHVFVSDSFTSSRSTRNCFKVLNKNRSYMGYTNNTGDFWPNNKNTTITISKLDSNQNTLWTTDFGGDAFYFLMDVSIAKDSGAFLTVTKYNWLTQSHQRDLYIYKIEKNGSMLGTPEYGGLKEIQVAVYPNPFKEVLQLQFLRETQKAVVNIFGLDGKCVVQETVHAHFGKHHISTAHLPSGMYVVHIHNKKGELIYREKLMKIE